MKTASEATKVTFRPKQSLSFATTTIRAAGCSVRQASNIKFWHHTRIGQQICRDDPTTTSKAVEIVGDRY